MDIRELRQLLAVADGGTLTRAADRLHITRQAVGKALRGIERETGTCLFERRAGELVPTPQGRALIEDARDVMERFEALCAAHIRPLGIAADGEGGDTLSIALVVGGSEALPRNLLESYMALHPQTTVNIEEMSTDMVFASVANGAYDIGIVGSHPDFLAGLEWCHVQSCGIWLLVPVGHPYANRSGLAVADLDGAALITPGVHNHLHRFVMDRCARRGVAPDVRAASTDGALILRLALEQRALCFGFAPDISPAPPGMAALPLDIEGGGAFGTYALRRPGAKPGAAGGPTAAAQLFWKAARALEAHLKRS